MNAVHAPAIYFHIRRAPAADIPRIRADAAFATLYVRAAMDAEFSKFNPTGPQIAASLGAIRNDPALKAALAEGVKGIRRLSPRIPDDVDQYLREAESMAADLRQPGPDDVFHLDKAWHILHYLFTGHADPATGPAATLCGGEKVGQKLIYGPARLIDIAPTREFADFLDQQTTAELHRRADIAGMHALKVYGCDEPSPPYEKRAHQWIRQYLPALRGFVRGAADRSDGLLMWLQ